MVKTLPVSLLKHGDKFEFVTGRSDESKNNVLIVTRDPAVNKIANSCHFRYQPDRSATSVDSKWDDNHSWNGTPDVQVRLIEVHAEVNTKAEPPVAPPPPAPQQVSQVAEKTVAEKTVEKKTKAAPKKRRL